MAEEMKLYPVPAEYLDLEQVLLGIQHLLAQFNWQSGRRVLPTTRGLRIPMRLLGVWLQPPNGLGVRDHLLQRKWKSALLTAGIDPERIKILDEAKLRAAIDRIQERTAQQKRERARHKQRTKDAGLHITEEEFEQLNRSTVNRGWGSSPASSLKRPSGWRPVPKGERLIIKADEPDTDFPPSGVEAVRNFY
jgi:hypothetical protein